ncbi:MAG: ABC transporter substrate-binding protein [Eubacteriales bacterium]|jgi:putative aldouronate transport system substrate-binding protein
MKKSLCALLSILMILCMLSACTGGEEKTTTAAATTAAATTAAATTAATTAAGPAGLDEVTIKWMVNLNYNKTAEAKERINTAINDYVKPLINATIDWDYVDSAEMSQKLSVMLTSGDHSDLIHISAGYGYNNYVAQGALRPLKALIDEYAPVLYDIVPEGAWTAVTYKGDYYAVVPYKDLAAVWNFLYNDDMVQECGMPFPEWTVVSDVVEYFYDMKEKRDELHPEWASYPMSTCWTYIDQWYRYDQMQSICAAQLTGLNDFEGQGDGETVFNIFSTNEYATICKNLKQMVDDGIFPYDNPNFDKDHAIFDSGAMLCNWAMGYLEVREDMYPFTTKLSNSKLAVMSTGYVQATLAALPAKGANPERSMMLLNLVNTDKTLADYIRFGQEGIDYQRVEDGRIDPYLGSANKGVESLSDLSWFNWYGHHVGNIVAGSIPTNNTVAFPDLLADLNDNSHQKSNLGFIIDNEPITNEIAACANIISEYNSTSYLRSGMIENIDAEVAAFNDKLNANGAEKILEEVQKQLNAWRAEMGMPVKG